MTRWGETRQIRMSIRLYGPDRGTDGSGSDTEPTDDSSSRVTRRRAVALGGGVLLTGGSLLAGGTDSASAQVTAEFTATGDDATLMSPPSAITVEASGSWEVTAAQQPEQVTHELAVLVNDTASVVAEDGSYESSQGDYTLSGDALTHPELSASDLMPSGDATEATTTLTLRVTIGAVIDGETVAEAVAEDTADVVITEQGVEVVVGGTGTITVEP